MGQKDGRVSQAIRRMMTVTGAVLTVLLTCRGFFYSFRAIPRDRAEVWLEEKAAEGLSALWRRSYPAVDLAEGETDSGQGKSPGEWLLGFAFEWLPFCGAGDAERPEGVAHTEADPAFAGFSEQGKFYEEHAFLLYDGGGETAGAGEGFTSSSPETGPAAPSGIPGEGEESGEAAVQAVKEDTGTYALRPSLPVSGTTYRKEQLADFDFLMKHFYSVHTSATAGRDLIVAERFLEKDFTLENQGDAPQILIYHTHSQEEFADYGPDRKEATVVGMGTYLTGLLTAKGYQVIHDTSVYDYRNGKLDRNKAYTYALEGITGILQQNPSIEVILDLHRDGVREGLHMVNEVNGKATAPIMFFNGVSQTPDGPIEYLQNPYREDNLAFSFQMQLDAAAYFPGLTRKIYIKGLRYNLHLRPRSALIEVGAQTNTYEEALNAMEPLAEVLDMVLQGN